MRVALLSDVHANLVALQAVLGELDRQGIERIYHAGDIVGYYPFPNETIQEFRRRGIVTILGNHDRAALNANAMGMNPMDRPSSGP
jgi:predicted phosphodiesterase